MTHDFFYNRSQQLLQEVADKNSEIFDLHSKIHRLKISNAVQAVEISTLTKMVEELEKMLDERRAN
jgi:SMC interacting uncharacterized protein involved in chromosome segregation